MSGTIQQGDGAGGSLQEELSMRFMFIVKTDQAASPAPALLEAMGKLVDREVKAGRLIDHGGLTPLSEGAQVRIKNGRLSVIDGPFVEAKEMIGGYALFELPGREEALAAMKEFMQLHLDLMPEWDGVCEMRALANGRA
jgi:hypothetical protein